jgi:hypothetical protein
MLTPFRSARSAKVPRFPLVLFAWVLALLVSGSFSSPQARMDEPVPAPHFEGWPDPEHSSRTPQSESNIADAIVARIQDGQGEESSAFDQGGAIRCLIRTSRFIQSLFDSCSISNRIP